MVLLKRAEGQTNLQITTCVRADTHTHIDTVYNKCGRGSEVCHHFHYSIRLMCYRSMLSLNPQIPVSQKCCLLFWLGHHGN